MAKIYLRGIGEIDISNEKAKEFKDNWYQGRYKDKKVNLGDIVFNGNEIKAVKLDAEIAETKQSEYDLNDPSQKAKVLEFEKEFLQWCKDNEGKYQKGERFNWFMQDKGAIKITGAYWQYSTIIKSGDKVPVLFNELTKLFSSLNSLRCMRKTASDYELQGLYGQINQAKEKMEVKSQPKSNLEKSSDEIDVSKIDF